MLYYEISWFEKRIFQVPKAGEVTFWIGIETFEMMSSSSEQP